MLLQNQHSQFRFIFYKSISAFNFTLFQGVTIYAFGLIVFLSDSAPVTIIETNPLPD